MSGIDLPVRRVPTRMSLSNSKWLSPKKNKLIVLLTDGVHQKLIQVEFNLVMAISSQLDPNPCKEDHNCRKKKVLEARPIIKPKTCS